MSERSAKATQDILEFFDRSPLTRVPSDSSLRAHGARWSNVSLALSGDLSMHDLSDIGEVQGLSLDKTISQGRLSRPASLDGGFACTETPSAADSMVDVCLSIAGTYKTAPEHTSYPKSQMPVPFEIPTSTAVPQNYFDCNIDDQSGAQAQSSVYLEGSITDTITYDNHKILAQDTGKSPIVNEGIDTSQGYRFVDGIALSPRKLIIPIHTQDEYPRRPTSPTTTQFKSRPNGKTELSRTLSAPLEELSGSVAMLPVPFAVEPLYKKLCSSSPSLADFTGSEHSDDLGSPHKMQNRTSETLEGQPGLGASSTDHTQKQRRVVDWVGTIPDSSCSNGGSITYDDLGIFHGQRTRGNESVSLYQRNSSGEEPSPLGIWARHGNTDFDAFWKKAQAKSMSPGPFSPPKGHFSPLSSTEVSPRPDGTTTGSQQKAKSPLASTTTPPNLKKISESSLTPALQRHLLRQLSASPPSITPAAPSGPARPRTTFTSRLPSYDPILRVSASSGSSISSELSPSELALGPANPFGTSISLDHLRPAPIPKVATHEGHIHPALRAYPFFNSADHVDGVTAPEQGPATRTNTKKPGVRFATEEDEEVPPGLSRDYMGNPMREEFARVAKEMSKRAALKKVRNHLADCGIDDDDDDDGGLLTLTAEVQGCKGGHEEACGSWRSLLVIRAELLCEVIVGDEEGMMMMRHGDTG